MLRGAIYTGTIAATANATITFNTSERVQRIFIHYASSTPDFLILSTNSGTTAVRNETNADYTDTTGRIKEHKIDMYTPEIQIMNEHATVGLSYTILTESEIS